jgi:PAS domain S-box-containing protein
MSIIRTKKSHNSSPGPAEGEELERLLDLPECPAALTVDADLLRRLVAERRETAVREARWRHALENVGDGVWDWHIPTGTVYFSPSWKIMLGYRDDEIENRYEEWRSRVHPEDIGAAEKEIFAHAGGKSTEYRNQHRLRCKDGTWKWILDRGQVVEYDADGKALRMVGTHTDITRQIELQKELEYNRLLLTRAQEMGEIGHWEIDLAAGIVTGSEVTRNIYGVSEISLPLETIKQAPLPEYRPLLDKAFEELIASDVEYDVEFKIRRPDGSILDVHSRAEIDREKNRIFGIIQNITDLKQAEHQVRALLEEKDLLLREVHHRVKNNLSLITSIISLQSSGIEDARALEALQELKGRVSGMQLIYDRLYRTSMYEESSLREYLSELTAEIGRSLLISGRVRIETRVEDTPLEISRIFPVGIVVNELVTNALKHAFPGTAGGIIRVNGAVSEEERRIVIQVEDDGIGIGPEVDSNSGGGFGLQMVRIMTKQLSGELSVCRVEPSGTVWTLSIPLSVPSVKKWERGDAYNA